MWNISEKREEKDYRYDKAGIIYINIIKPQVESKKKLKY